MIPTRWQPSKGSMAIIARLGGFIARGVACRLASRLTSVMAIRTLACHRRTMVIAYAQPSCGIEVTRFARRISYDMFVVLGSRNYAFADSMTAITSSWRTLENSASVATFASGCSVTTRKREAGSHVIEVAPDLLSCPRLQRRHCQQHGEHCTDKT
jgi:hypothetical protein